MEESAELADYLPLSFKTPKEQEYIEFLWDAFETNHTHGKYQFVFLAYNGMRGIARRHRTPARKPRPCRVLAMEAIRCMATGRGLLHKPELRFESSDISFAFMKLEANWGDVTG